MTVTQLSSPSLSELPSAFAIKLTDYSAISLKGEEQTKYLQGQVTCDVNSLIEHPLLNGAHCNAKGKVFSAFRLFNYQNAHLLFQPKSTLQASLAELQKFGVFAKVEIRECTDLAFYIIAGKTANQSIKQYFEQVPDNLNPVINKGNSQIVYLAGQTEHYLYIAPIKEAEKLMTSSQLPIYQSSVWQLLEIAEGFPALQESAIGEYVPQMLNLQAINGISFTKGCYLGQETVARMKYLGKNKRALFSLQGHAKKPIEAGNIIETQLGDNWRKAGDVITHYLAEDNTIYIQAVLNNDIQNDTQLRIKGDEDSYLVVANLPYTISE